MLRFDISDFPVELDILIGAYEGPGWATKPFRHRSGWFMVAEAHIMTAFGERSALLVAAISDHGETYLPHVAARLLDLPMSMPRDAECGPPTALEEAMEVACWDFLGTVDLECLNLLADAQERIDQKILAFEAEGAALEDRVWNALRRLRAERRRDDTTEARRIEIDTQMTRLLDMPEELAAGMRLKKAEMRNETTSLEEAVLAGLSEEDAIEWEHRCTIRWRARSRTSHRNDIWLPKVPNHAWLERKSGPPTSRDAR